MYIKRRSEPIVLPLSGNRLCFNLSVCEDPKINTIIVANTNTKESEFSFYINEAKSREFQVFSLVIENRHGGKDTHNVPKETLEKQKTNIYNSLKLI